MEEIKIVCDSLSDITQEYIDKYDIEVIPLNVIIDDVEYKDRVTITTEEFYRRIREEKAMPKTSQITYADYYKVFDTIYICSINSYWYYAKCNNGKRRCRRWRYKNSRL